MLKIGNKGVSPVVGTILLIAITVALAAVVATLVSGLGGRGAPPNALLAVNATSVGSTGPVLLNISHNGGDDLSLSDLQVRVVDNNGSYDNNTIGTGTFTVGHSLTVWTTATDNFNSVITVYIIHKPSKEKIFSSSTVAVQQG